MEPKPVRGLDTETYQGYAYLICDSEGGYLWIQDIDSALEYLTQRRFRQKHNFFYNLRFDYQAILKWLPESFLFELYSTKSTQYDSYHIKYIPKKLLSITKGKHNSSFYDLAPFF